MQKTKKFRRLLAALLAVLMLSIGIPAMAFANGDDGQVVRLYCTFVNLDDGTALDGTVELQMIKGVTKYEKIYQQLTAPEGFEITEEGNETGDVYVDDGKSLNIYVVPTNVTMNVRFMEGDTFVSGGDYTLPRGTQNYSILEQYVPTGYKMSVSGDFTVTAGGKIEVAIEEIATTGIMNVRFMDGDTFVSGGDYTLPLGTQNYSILNEYVPEGYKMSVSGDFMVTDGGKIEVAVEKISTDVIMTIRFMDGDTFVAGGDYFLPEGVQNYSVLEQYLPEGYKLSVSGDLLVAEGASLDVPVEKIVKDVIMNIRFMDGDTFVSGGDYFLPEGVQNYNILNDLVPVGYEMSVSGDFTVAEGTSLDVPVEKVNDAIIVNIAFVDPYGNVVAGGDYFVPAGVQNRQVLDRYVPQGYKQAETGDILFEAGEHYDIALVEDTSIVNIRFVDMEGNFIAGGDYFVPTGIHNRSVLNQYLPEGYYQVVTGDIQFIYGQQYEIVIDLVPETATAKTAVFRKAADDVWNENSDNPDEVHYTFWSFDPDEPCTVPSITTGDKSKALDYWVCDLDETVTLQPGEDFCYNDLDQGKLAGCSGDFAFYPVYKDVTTTASNTNNTTTVTASSNDSSDEVVKASTPADNTTKILPQTGNQGVVSPVSFVVVLCAALAGAAVYLFVIRKKLN